MRIRELVAELAKHDADMDVIVWFGGVGEPFEIIEVYPSTENLRIEVHPFYQVP